MGAGSSFVNASMAGSILTQGTFYSDNFQGANLTGANFSDTDLRGTTFTQRIRDERNFTGGAPLKRQLHRRRRLDRGTNFFRG